MHTVGFYKHTLYNHFIYTYLDTRVDQTRQSKTFTMHTAKFPKHAIQHVYTYILYMKTHFYLPPPPTPPPPPHPYPPKNFYTYINTSAHQTRQSKTLYTWPTATISVDTDSYNGHMSKFPLSTSLNFTSAHCHTLDSPYEHPLYKDLHIKVYFSETCFSSALVSLPLY